MPKLSFEKQLARLEEIVEKLEAEQTDLDTSVKLFEEGILLSQELSKRLETVKFKVQELKRKGTQLVTTPFDTELTEQDNAQE